MPDRPTHQGIDIQRTVPRPAWGEYGAIMGEPVFAMHSGTVLRAAWGGSNPGFWVIIRSDVIDPASNTYLVSRFIHLRDYQVARNQIISQGTHVGHVGNTGHTIGSGPGRRSSGHLHIDVNNNNLEVGDVYGNSINPQRFFPQINFEGALSTIVP